MCRGVSTGCSIRFGGSVRPRHRVRSTGRRGVDGAVGRRACVGVHGRGRVCGVSVHLFLRRTGSGQDDPANEEQRRRGPADVDGRPELPPLGLDGQRVLEVGDGECGRPADRDKNQDGGDNDQAAGDDHHLGFGRILLQAPGAFGADEGDDEADEAEDQGDDDERPGGLQVPGQPHHRLIEFTLHLSRALHHAVHPQAVPHDLARHDVGADEGRDPPHGDTAGHRYPHQAREADDLTGRLLADPPHGDEALITTEKRAE